MISLGLARHHKPVRSSPLEGSATFRAQQAQIALEKLQRQEWWLWFWAIAVTALALAALTLTAFPSLFRHSEHFYDLRSEQARTAILGLLLLFNLRMVQQQAKYRRLRKQAAEPKAETEQGGAGLCDTTGTDPLTGLLTRGSVLQPLGKEIARAKRQNVALTVATLHLEDLGRLYIRYGNAAMDLALKEFARRLKEVSRGSDYAVRLGNDDFLLVLPKCNLREVSQVLNRVGAMELDCAGKKITLTYTTGWVDYQPGDTPSDLLKRASELLKVYNNAAKEAFAPRLVAH